MSRTMAQQLAADAGASELPVLTPTGSGTTGQCYRVRFGAGETCFLKTGPASRLELFAAEREGLAELARAGALRVPRSIAHGCVDGTAYLLLEAVELLPPSELAQRRMGAGLARQHRHGAARWGWHRDNALGVNPQPNPPGDDWIGFFAEHRLRHQVRLAMLKGCDDGLADAVEALIGRLGWFFEDYQPAISLLHGDLWAGNWAMDASEDPVAFDPAVYYGDREVDLAQTLNGGFSPAFYAAYQEEWPVHPGFHHRRHLYNFHMVLNELNRVGPVMEPQVHAYLRQLMDWMDQHGSRPVRTQAPAA